MSKPKTLYGAISQTTPYPVPMPAASRGKTESYAVLYMTDGGRNVNEIGSTIDFLADHSIPPLIVVGIANTDRVRDLTPTRADVKESGSVTSYPTSGGAEVPRLHSDRVDA